MRIDKVLRAIGPVIAMAAAAGLGGCNSANISLNGEDGVPLADLDLTGPAPEEVALLGPDKVVVTQGGDFTIEVEGDSAARARMRFVLAEGTLGIMREKGNWNDGGVATVNVTMPAPRKVTVAGSGEVTAHALAREASVVIAGSGRLATPELAVDTLGVTIAGSGRYSAGGSAGALDQTIAGSGLAEMGDLAVGQAEVEIAGSGDSTFASNGTVNARIMGSGVVTVRGSATCNVQSFGSGRLVCERGTTGEAA